MQKSTNSHKRRKKLNFLTITSLPFLALLSIFLEDILGSNSKPSTFQEIGTRKMSSKFLEKDKNLRVGSTSYENLVRFKKLGLLTNIRYMLEGVRVAVLALLIYPQMACRENKFTKDSLKSLCSPKIWKIAGAEEGNQKSFQLKKRRLFTAIPVLCIAFAEILMFLEKVGIAIWVHIGILIALSLSNIFVKDSEVQKIHQALMLLPLLRIINLSMPIFFETTLYTFIFIYGSLAIPMAVVIIHQRYSLEQIGISMKNIETYMILSIPLSLALGFGEYLTIRTGYLIPDLTFENLLKLTFIMVFFVGLVEELTFRSILQTRLEQTLSVGESLLITTLLFGLMHSGYGTFYEILYTSIVGLFIGVAFYKTKSLPFIVVLHGFINVFLFGILPHYLTGRIGF